MQKKALYGLIMASLIGGTALAGGPDTAPPAVKWHPFVGANYSYLNASVRTTGITSFTIATGSVRSGLIPRIADDYSGLGLLAGMKYGRYMGFVMGWNHYWGEGKTISATGPRVGNATGQVGGSTYTRPENFYVDFRGYYPFYYGFNLIGSIGTNISDFTVSSQAAAQGMPAVLNATNVNLRLGAGADYYFTPNWGIEGMFNYVFQHAPSNIGQATANTAAVTMGTTTGIWKNFWTANIGVNYMFS